MRRDAAFGKEPAAQNAVHSSGSPAAVEALAGAAAAALPGRAVAAGFLSAWAGEATPAGLGGAAVGVAPTAPDASSLKKAIACVICAA